MTAARNPTFRTALAFCCLAVGMISSAGCNRQYYRRQADLVVNTLIDQTANRVARPPNTSLNVNVDRRSRMFNPFDLDFQPMPLDDPASYQYLQCVDGRRGYPMWEAAGVTNTAESPDWMQFLPVDENGVLVLDADTAVRIALLNSPDYQFQVEQLYLSALVVSAERFRFATQFFGGSGFSFTREGRLRSGFPDGSTRLGIEENGLRFNRSLATGGELVAGIANSIVWELSGPSGQSATTILDFSILQPLLRRAGRDVVLEQLTAAERALLANIRSFERYRRAFYLTVTIGRSLESTLVLGGTNIGGVGGVSFGAGGFLGLLQNELQIRNGEENIARLTENVLLLEDALIESLTTIPEDPTEIVTQRLQVAQARSRLLTSQAGLIGQQAGFQLSVDQFLRTLGLPPYICVKLDDPVLNQFELIDRQLLARNEELSKLRGKVGEINVSILESGEYQVDQDSGVPVSQIRWTDELAGKLRELRIEILPLVDFTKELIESDLPTIKQDIENLDESLAGRRKQTESLSAVYRREQESICGLLNLSAIDESIFAVEELTTLSSELSTSHAALKERFESYRDRIEKLDQAFEKLLEQGAESDDPKVLAQRLRDEVVLASQDLVTEIGDDVLALQLIQARARTESVLLPAVEIDPQTAFEIARKNRRDLANARAALVDAWRQIEVVADDLESDLDVVFSGDVQNVGSNPLDLRTSNGRLRAGLQWDAPITRVLERNAYRATLINYERAKRNYYRFEDGIWQQLRAEVRQLHANRLSFELSRQGVRIAAEQIELTSDRRALNEARGRSSGPTAARDVIDALDTLLGAQNGLLNIFVSYEVVRRGLNFDLGTMELTPEGLWIDSGEISTQSLEGLLALPGTTAGGMIGGQCNQCCLPNMPLPVDPEYAPPFEAAPMLPMEQYDGLLESDRTIHHDPVHVARLPELWEADSEPIVDQTMPILARPKVNILPNGEVEIENP